MRSILICASILHSTPSQPRVQQDGRRSPHPGPCVDEHVPKSSVSLDLIPQHIHGECEGTWQGSRAGGAFRNDDGVVPIACTRVSGSLGAHGPACLRVIVIAIVMLMVIVVVIAIVTVIAIVVVVAVVIVFVIVTVIVTVIVIARARVCIISGGGGRAQTSAA